MAGRPSREDRCLKGRLLNTLLDYRSVDIYQIAALRIADGDPDPQQPTFHCYVKLDRDIPLVIQKRTRVTPEDFVQAVPLEQAVADFRQFIGDLPLAAHNGRFDSSFVRYASEVRCKQGDITNPVLDTLELAVLLHPALSAHRLESLSNELLPADYQEQPVFQGLLRRFEVQGKTYHDARYDAIVAWYVFQRLVDDLNALDAPFLSEWLRLLPRERYPLSNLITEPGVTASSDPLDVMRLGSSAHPPRWIQASVPFDRQRVLGYYREDGKLHQGLAR